jgi:hypothetical protein
MSNYHSGEVEGTEPQPATRNELAGAATKKTLKKTLKRARWEHLCFAACPGTKRVNVTNYSYGVAAVWTGEHTYTVTLAPDSQPESCTCPTAEYRPGPCKHAVAVADAPDVIAEAAAQASFTDGHIAVGERLVTLLRPQTAPHSTDRMRIDSNAFRWFSTSGHICIGSP